MPSVLRETLLYLSSQPRIFKFVRKNALAKKFAERFVAGETLDVTLDAVQGLNAKRMTASLDLLGESVTSEAEARAMGHEYVRILDRIRERSLDANVSVKLTAMGLDISEDLCVEVMHGVLARARDYGTFVRLDMESSAYTERTLRLFYDRLYAAYPDNVGIVLQSYLRRTPADVEQAIQTHCRVRLCKGAYQEPPTVAFPEKKTVDTTYLACMERLLASGNYPGIATHDERIIARTKLYAASQGIPPAKFEFQMLYGVRRDLQESLVRDGYRLRVYVPFGTQWYPYLMRRLAERPANLAFITGNVVKEAFGRGGRQGRIGRGERSRQGKASSGNGTQAGAS